jgi:NadR type nicotinamide-nucleotide adenylyltransferase
MAMALAAHYQTAWVPEYGREYWMEKHRRGEIEWRTEEFASIAYEQLRREDEVARDARFILICDTDALATSVWHERYLGVRSSEVASIAAPRHYDLYLLTNVDIPFVQDGMRDGEHIRLAMHQRFIDALEAQERPYILLSGAHEDRLRVATEAIDALLAAPYPWEELRLRTGG